ncbi:hypothetical protein EN745_13765 [Mesorhizobium sp. M4A.F.Ca.ET.022.05.2.1]|uniref:hypothetical protein n=1 Tax=Mesorhizobium sp. M4A.F.Ca.ET.022.05.2.1 TaxID=2496653 RepID=UPI000FCA8838|nr:hypothetical protein [Mesorhizobium sp. M4A.F.Ca.ET.022.05.2.1]RVC80169.1 hypothetical protein EN745_13765 [Mesorhizobium sp. M4A.F.Ca.ET.022.05.2.1]
MKTRLRYRRPESDCPPGRRRPTGPVSRRKSNVGGIAGRSAEEKHSSAPKDNSVLIPDDDEAVAEIVRRTERLAIAITIGMGVCLILGPIVFVTLF